MGAIKDNDPVLFFEHKKAYRLLKGEVPEGDYTIPLGKADVKREGDDITVITYGLCVNYAIQAAEQLKKKATRKVLRNTGPSYAVSLDKEAIIKAASKTGKVL